MIISDAEQRAWDDFLEALRTIKEEHGYVLVVSDYSSGTFDVVRLDPDEDLAGDLRADGVDVFFETAEAS